jgi:hypothetical protein
MVLHVPHASPPVTHPLHNLLYPGCLQGGAYVTSNFYASHSKSVRVQLHDRHSMGYLSCTKFETLPILLLLHVMVWTFRTPKL